MRVKIYQPAKTPMQSGKKQKKWLLEYTPKEQSRYIEPIMGWTANSDTKHQIKLAFSSKEQAIAYAEKQGLAYQVMVPKKNTLKLQSYADNFLS